MTKKLAIIGRGTAGCFAAAHFLKWTDWEIDWYYDPNVKTQSVGEGLTPLVCKSLYENLGFEHYDLDKVDGSFKYSIFKKNWSKNTFHHAFATPMIAWHVNAVKLQNYIFEKLRFDPRINTIEQNILHDQIDSDYIFDCSGFPKDLSKIDLMNIPVNAVHVTQCYWDYPKFSYTRTEARPHGWFFGIPLKNRCSIGYMYNDNYATLDQIKEDSNNIFREYDLTPSEDTITFPFKSFIRKKNFDGRVAYNGNASFFLEPLEATTINTTDYVQRLAWEYWVENNQTEEEVNLKYHQRISGNEDLIMMHYFAGSVFENDFWKMAHEKGANCMRKAIQSPVFYDRAFRENRYPKTATHDIWTAHSLDVNFEGLDLYDKFRMLI